MSNISNTEAFDGMREAEQISRPILDVLKTLQRELTEQNQKMEQYLEQLKEEKRPKQLEKQLREAEKEYTKALDKEIKQCAANGYPEMAEKLEERKELMQRSIENNIDTIKGKAWVGQSYDQELSDASKELSTMLSMQKELTKDNKSMDYSRTMEKMDAIIHNSPFLERAGIAKNEWDIDAPPQNPMKSIAKDMIEKPEIPKTKLQERFIKAINESKTINASKGTNPIQQAKESLERCL